ncbi:MAG: beta-ketoacyl-ACP synthase II [Planctomycetes bacterium]|nr:beta-ketoacyl-ACP synthase II [Planctomycetota bacterium]MCB9871400.1 beta-ketoacyl-ACP synthase II [Planctomycetota bacterium]
MGRRRVVITGLGVVTPVGLDLESTWRALLEGVSGAGPVTEFDASQHSTRFLCAIKGFDPLNYFEKTEARRMDPYCLYQMVAAMEAMRHSGLDMSKEDPTRAGCIFGTGIGGISEIEEQKMVMRERGPGRVSPFFIPKLMSNASAGQASIRFGLQGTSFSTGSACASASNAIGIALRTVQYGEADMMLTGGSEKATTELALAGFCSLKALSKRNDDPQRASRPFDRDRDGFVMGDGGAAIVLEELEHARARGADIIAELCGYGSTDDAFHITAPAEDALGPRRAIEQALHDARLAPEDVDYVNAHGTSTHLNDKVETKALRMVFGSHADKLQVSSTKSMIGHLLGASGAVELAFSAMAVRTGQIPPTINYETPDPECDLDYVPNQARQANVRVAISNSLGFGGHNTCLALRRFED